MSKGGFKMFETKKLSNLINYPFTMVSRSRQYSRRDSRKSCLEEASSSDVEMCEVTFRPSTPGSTR
jgi:hypothetical protein